MPTPTSQREIPSGSRSLAVGERMPLLYLHDGQGWSGWNGPGQPPNSLVPSDQPTRGWQYPAFWNASGDAQSSKGQETGGPSFAAFEAFSKQVHIAAAIATVKNTQCKKEWAFQLRAKPGEQAADLARRAAADPRLAEVDEFFREPDGEHDLADWLRLILDDLLVNDAPAVYCVRSIGGRPLEAEVFHGATIKPLLDVDGRAPRSPLPAYQQWLYGSPGDEFTRDEMIYAPRNPRPGKAYGCSPVEQLMFYINLALRKDIQRLATYTDGNVPAGLLPMPATWTNDEIWNWWTTFNTFVKGLPANVVKMMPIPGGVGNPIFPALQNNSDQWEESWIRLVCFSFDIPVQSLVKEMNRATAEVGRDSAEQDGQAAYTDYIRRFLNRIIRSWFGYRDIVAVPKREADVEAKTQADIDDLEIKVGSLQINEKREREGRPPLKELTGKVGYFGPMGFTAFDAPAPAAVPGGLGVAPLSDQATSSPSPVTEAFNGAQVTAATAIVTAVANRTIPRDSGLGQLIQFFGKTPEEAEQIMGSAGMGEPMPTSDTAEAAREATKAANDDISTMILQIIKQDDEAIVTLGAAFHVEGVATGISQVGDLLAVDTVVGIDDPRVVQLLATKANQIVSVNESTAALINEKVTSMVDEGSTPEDIGRAIRDAFDLRQAQAEVIARNEVGGALSGGRFIEMNDSGVVETEWVTSGLPNVRPSHDAQNHETRKLGEAFTNGCRYPQDPEADEDETINCNCVALPVVDTARSVELRKGIAGAHKQINDAVDAIAGKMAPKIAAMIASQAERVLAALKDQGIAA